MDDSSLLLPTFTGTEVGYYFVCPKKLWWFAHGVTMEHESDRVKMGKLVHQESYARKKRELNIDDKIVLDWREDGVIHEVKLTEAMEEAHEMQLAYYLYYLRLKGVENLRGQIDYPKLRETKDVELTPELEAKLTAALSEMRRIVSAGRPPGIQWMKICRACSYAELCWG
ncbi:MAG TPA: CRISPR-associated protein Cas4 [Blastocatellia bacterium]|nr:CRISPR-associated protein Cas4 [Blastocatellia bacterium]